MKTLTTCNNCNKTQKAKKIKAKIKAGFDLRHIPCQECGQHTLTQKEIKK